MKNKFNIIPGLFAATCLFIFSNSKLNAQTSIEADPLIQELVVLKAKMVENNTLNERYKIQLFYGSNLNEANKVKKEFETTYSEWRSDIVFETPNYKVWVGDFRNRLEAERAFVKLKKDFKSAIIFKP
ncbi:SPOR domain-containing protein [Mesonia mobilis]|uniref:Sporulation protein n=1 Tax=Mesonia mobilis TaxID=369791 RepID=A0ABQ3BH10_9FLAO|nr:SPOR domain-containing protein [Mesonia mobilis]MBQ0736689.1 SPOR domain-containing protein [Aquimarina celericrescens]GGZ44879.1 sporulation protein [Mesonia mobilis]